MMPRFSEFKRAIAPRIRDAFASSRHATILLNHSLGVLRSCQYPRSAEASEALDPVSDIGPLLELREDIRRVGDDIAYPNRLQAMDRIYGIRSALFGDDGSTPGQIAIEHGLFLGKYIYPADTVYAAAPIIATFSAYRRTMIHSFQALPVFDVGPYIAYADPHYPKSKIDALRERNGRTLLVFPTHTTEDSSLLDDFDARFGWIGDLADNFDTVLVNVFWWDLTSSTVDRLTNRGYTVVSAGLTHDRNFLRRLRTLIRMADLVAGDGIGTHIGYALNEGVPFKLAGNSTVQLDMTRRPWLTNRNDRDALVLRLKQDLVRTEGSVEAQQTAVGRYWGVGQVRTPEELKSIREIGVAISARSHGFSARYPEVATTLAYEYQDSAPDKHQLLIQALPSGRADVTATDQL